MHTQSVRKQIQRALNRQEMLIIVGKCTVKYDGRAGSRLDEGERLVLIKGDRSFAVHQNQKLMPINYQPPGCIITHEENENTLIIKSLHRKPIKETIEVMFSEVSFAQSFSLKDNKKLRLGGMEKHIHKKLIDDLSMIEPGLKPIKKESYMSKGAIDIYAKDKNNAPVIIEVKRRKAGFPEATQLKRYVDELRKQKGNKIRGILAAPDITDKAKKMLQKEDLEFYKMDYEMNEIEVDLKGFETKQRALNEFI